MMMHSTQSVFCHLYDGSSGQKEDPDRFRILHKTFVNSTSRIYSLKDVKQGYFEGAGFQTNKKLQESPFEVAHSFEKNAELLPGRELRVPYDLVFVVCLLEKYLKSVCLHCENR